MKLSMLIVTQGVDMPYDTYKGLLEGKDALGISCVNAVLIAKYFNSIADENASNGFMQFVPLACCDCHERMIIGVNANFLPHPVGMWDVEHAKQAVDAFPMVYETLGKYFGIHNPPDDNE